MPSTGTRVSRSRRHGGRQKDPWAFLRRLAALTLALTAALALATVSPAIAGGGGTKGEPQPELDLFKVAAGSGSGGGTVLPDGTLLLAAPLNGNIVVCRLHPGGRKCASTATLLAHSSDNFDGAVPEVLATGGKDVSIVAEDCCYFGTPTYEGGAAVFDSTNDGISFGQEIYAGTIGSVDAGTVASGQLVVGGNSYGLRVQAFPPSPSSAATTVATPNSAEDGADSLATYKGGVLVASDDTNGNTLVEYAIAGSNFNASGSYKRVATIKGEDLYPGGLSGNALLTDKGGSITGGSERLRFFNGSSYGAPHKVPEPYQGDDGYFTIEEVGNVVHVFFLNRRNGYDIYSETTTNGMTWSKLTVYHTAITSDDLVPVLDSIGSGLLYESATGSYPSLAQPILLSQFVHVTLAHGTVTVGTPTKLSGTASPHLSGQTVTLERLAAGRWYNVGTTKESSKGNFSFTVPGKTETYRAVVAYKPGYYLYGYSNSATLTTTPKS